MGGSVDRLHPPPPGDPELLEAPKVPKEFLWPKLTCAKGASGKFLTG